MSLYIYVKTARRQFTDIGENVDLLEMQFN